jgi:hypothetical protein
LYSHVAKNPIKNGAKLRTGEPWEIISMKFPYLTKWAMAGGSLMLPFNFNFEVT